MVMKYRGVITRKNVCQRIHHGKNSTELTRIQQNSTELNRIQQKYLLNIAKFVCTINT